MITKIQTHGWQNAIIGMRYSHNSEDKMDSTFVLLNDENGIQLLPVLGIDDLDLMKRLINAGSEHRKVLRAIHIQMSVNMSMNWWKQYDTYKVATTTLSRSTMHKLMDKELTIDDFYLNEENVVVPHMIELINEYIKLYKTITDNVLKKELFHRSIDSLPMSYKQERMIDISYETALNILLQRKSHKLKEWVLFCDEMLDKIPYLKEFYEFIKEKQK